MRFEAGALKRGHGPGLVELSADFRRRILPEAFTESLRSTVNYDCSRNLRHS